MTSFNGQYEVLDSEYQVAVKKVHSPCGGVQHCTVFGPYAYEWVKKTLFREGEDWKLSSEEIILVEKLIKTRQVGDSSFNLTPDVEKSPTWRAVLSKLGVDQKVGSKGPNFKPIEKF